MVANKFVFKLSFTRSQMAFFKTRADRVKKRATTPLALVKLKMIKLNQEKQETIQGRRTVRIIGGAVANGPTK